MTDQDSCHKFWSERTYVAFVAFALIFDIT